MPTMKLPDAIAGVGAKCTLVLLDRVYDCELVEAHTNAIIKSVGGESAFVDDALLCKFKILGQTKMDPAKAAKVVSAMQTALRDRSERHIEVE